MSTSPTSESKLTQTVPESRPVNTLVNPRATLQKFVVYSEKNRHAETIFIEVKGGHPPWAFADIRGFGTLTGFPDIKQEVFDLDTGKFVPAEVFTPFVAPGVFFITKPAHFRLATCLGVNKCIKQLRRSVNKRKRELPVDSDSSTQPAMKRLRPVVEITAYPTDHILSPDVPSETLMKDGKEKDD